MLFDIDLLFSRSGRSSFFESPEREDLPLLEITAETGLWYGLLNEVDVQNRSSRPGVFCKKGVLRNFTGKYLCQSLFFNKVAGLMPATLLKKRLAGRRFPVNFVKFLRTTFFTTEHLCSGGCFWTLIMTSIFIMSNIAAFRVTFRIRSQSYQTSKGGASSYGKFS